MLKSKKIEKDTESIPAKSITSVTEKVTEQVAKTVTEELSNEVTNNIATEVAEEVIEEEESILETWYSADQMPPTWEVTESIRCPGHNAFADYVLGSDDHWYFRLAGPEYRPLDARELRWFGNWRHAARPTNTIAEFGEDDFF